MWTALLNSLKCWRSFSGRRFLPQPEPGRVEALDDRCAPGRAAGLSA